MRFQRAILICASVAVLGAVVAVATDDETTTVSSAELGNQGTSQQKLPALFDFEKYQQMFNKHYGSLVEAMVRRSYFIPRALRVVTSAVAYRFGQKDYHLAINHMSDYTPEEVESMQNHHRNDDENGVPKPVDSPTSNEGLAADSADSSEQPTTEEDKQVVDASDDKLKSELNEWASEEPAVKELLASGSDNNKEHQRKRRSLTESSSSEPQVVPTVVRHLDLDDLISTGKNARLPEGSNIRDYVPSNNRDYEPIELMSQGIPEQMKKVNYYQFNVAPIEKQTLDNAFIRQRKTLLKRQIEWDRKMRSNFVASTPKVDGDDNVVVDLSKDPCMDLPRSQGKCGSCWAFSAITILEWLYCKANNNQLARLSEQYLVDCSAEYYAPAGCSGSNTHTVHGLVRNFGLELRKNYPYIEGEQTCPLDRENGDIKTAGYIRMEIDGWFGVPMSLWEETVHYAPLDITVYTTGSNFQDYGRGIHDLTCSEKRNSAHAMVLVGYGEQNGKKYWKLRNSYGIGWGEEGYYRVSRDTKCLDNTAAAYASMDGFKYQLDRIEKNSKHDIKRIKAAYWASPEDKKRQEEKKGWFGIGR